MHGQALDLTRRQAAGRVLQRRRPPGERVIGPGADGKDVTVQEPGEFFPPESLGDWLDDELVVRCQFRGQFTYLLAEVLDAARVSTAAAAAALLQAKRLDPVNQWLLFNDLRELKSAARLPDARDLTRALLRTWEKSRGLRTSAPEAAELGQAPDPRPPSRDVPARGAAGVAVF